VRGGRGEEVFWSDGGDEGDDLGVVGEGEVFLCYARSGDAA
jgi:hypothetical protein